MSGGFRLDFWIVQRFTAADSDAVEHEREGHDFSRAANAPKDAAL